MAFKLIPRTLQTTILGIEFSGYEHHVSPLKDGPWYRLDIVVNDEAYSCEIQLMKPRGHGFRARPAVFGALRYPASILAEYARRFAEGEVFSFPIDIGDIGKV